MPTFSPDQPILVASDMSPRSDRATRRAFALAQQLKSQVVVLTVLDDAMPDDLLGELKTGATNKMERFCKSLAGDVDYKLDVRNGDPTFAILQAVEDHDAGLLVMGTHRPRPFLDALRETTMQRVVRRTACPVLLVRDRQDHGYDSVLAACDFSPASTGALRLAAQISPQSRINPLHVLHVPYSGMLGTTGDAADELRAAFEKEAREADAAWRDQNALPDQVGETNIVPGAPLAVLMDEVARLGIDLIAVGAHGRVGSAPAVLGSLANDLMRDAPCDVLISRV